jgi:hypothetical protein
LRLELVRAADARDVFIVAALVLRDNRKAPGRLEVNDGGRVTEEALSKKVFASKREPSAVSRSRLRSR